MNSSNNVNVAYIIDKQEKSFTNEKEKNVERERDGKREKKKREREREKTDGERHRLNRQYILDTRYETYRSKYIADHLQQPRTGV